MQKQVKRLAKSLLVTLAVAWLGSLFLIQVLGIKEPFFESLLVLGIALASGFITFTSVK